VLDDEIKDTLSIQYFEFFSDDLKQTVCESLKSISNSIRYFTGDVSTMKTISIIMEAQD